MVRIGDSGEEASDAALGQLNDTLSGRACNTSGAGVGLLVTPEIARRHGLTVHFQRLVSGGLAATVALSDALFETAPTCSPALR